MQYKAIIHLNIFFLSKQIEGVRKLPLLRLKHKCIRITSLATCKIDMINS